MKKRICCVKLPAPIGAVLKLLLGKLVIGKK